MYERMEVGMTAWRLGQWRSKERGAASWQEQMGVSGNKGDWLGCALQGPIRPQGPDRSCTS